MIELFRYVNSKKKQESYYQGLTQDLIQGLRKGFILHLSDNLDDRRNRCHVIPLS